MVLVPTSREVLNVASPLRTPTTAESLVRLEALVSPMGVMTSVQTLNPHRGLDRVTSCISLIGSGTPGLGIPPDGQSLGTRGGGRAVDDPALARLIAIAEGAERYCGGGLLGEGTVLAAAAALDGPALDLARVARCSQAELAAGCPLPAVDPTAPMRWVRGVNLSSGEQTWIPAVMACYGLRDALPSERFWYRISTGHAVHFDPAEALVRGICEVIERDVIAVSWLQKLPLPLVARSQLSAVSEYLLDWGDRHFIGSYLFDATSDIGVPTVYCLQVAPYDDKARHVVGCGTGRTLGSAAEKALLETISVRKSCYSDKEFTEDFRNFTTITDGSRFMARPERSAAFGFLVDGARERVAPERQPLPEDSAEALAWLIDALSRAGMQVFALQRTPHELATVGLTAVSVVIPDLQPMTLLPLAQFRAHPRLYSAPALMGYPVFTEEELNPWPQPFA